MIEIDEKQPLDRGFIHVRWLDYDVKTALVPMEFCGYGYDMIFETWYRIMQMLGLTDKFNEEYPAREDLQVKFYRRERMPMDSAELPNGLSWNSEIEVSPEEALAEGVYCRIERWKDEQD